jgi:nucleotide-binding universal stress UspA family protein
MPPAPSSSSRRPGDTMTPQRSDTNHSPERIVVGIDGSGTAIEALRWAVDEARRRNATVEAVCAWHQAFVAPTHILGDPAPFERDAMQLLDSAIDEVDTSGVTVDRKLRTGNASQALLHEAKGAALLVVGSRGRGGFTGLLLGSVSQQVAHHAPCPVVIVPATP